MMRLCGAEGYNIRELKSSSRSSELEGNCFTNLYRTSSSFNPPVSNLKIGGASLAAAAAAAASRFLLVNR